MGSTILSPTQGRYELYQLTENGIVIFPSTLAEKVPEAVQDATEAARCIAFELPTAAAFPQGDSAVATARINSAVVTITITAHPVTQKPGNNPALESYYVDIALRGEVGALRIRTSAASNGIGVRSGLAGRSGFGSFLLMTGV
jgi:ribosomal protein S5